MFSLIVTDYRTINQSVAYIQCFLQNCIDKVDVVIVDNSENRQGKVYLDSQNIQYGVTLFRKKKVYHFSVCQKEISILEAAENGGYSKGNNLGAAYSDSVFDNPYYIFSNNDVEFTGCFTLKLFVKLFAEKNNIGIIGPNVITPDGGRQNPRKMMNFVSQMLLQPYNILWFRCRFNKWLWNLESDCRGECGWVSGSFMVVRQEAFKKAGTFDEHVFLYGEEMILSERMRKLGIITFYEPDITVIHHHQGAKSNYNSRKQNHISVRYYYGEYKGIHEFALKFSDFCFELAEWGYRLKKKIVG